MTLDKDFLACERATDRLWKLLGLDIIDYGEDVRPSIRGLLIEVIFKAGDRRQNAMRRYLPGVRAIFDQAIEQAKRSLPNSIGSP